MLRTTSRLQALSRTLDTRAAARPHFISTSAAMSANMSYVSAKDACPRECSLDRRLAGFPANLHCKSTMDK